MSKALVKSAPGVALTSLADFQRFANIAVASGHFQSKGGGQAAIADAVLRIQAGAEVGLGPYASLTGVTFISGRPTYSANAIAGLVKQSGVYDYRVRHHDNSSCRLEWFQAKESVGFSEFSVEDAMRAGLVRGGSNWEKYPKAMVFARALTAGARTYCPDVFIGGVYTPEELGGGEQVEVLGGDHAPEPATEPEPVEDGEFEEPKQTQDQARVEARKHALLGCAADDQKALDEAMPGPPEALPAEEQDIYRLAKVSIGLMLKGEVPDEAWHASEKRLAVWAQAKTWVPELATFEEEVWADRAQDAEDKRIEDEGKTQAAGGAS